MSIYMHATEDIQKTLGISLLNDENNSVKTLLVRKKVRNENEYLVLSTCVSAFLNIKFSE